jgi:hypothetical protein
MKIDDLRYSVVCISSVFNRELQTGALIWIDDRQFEHRQLTVTKIDAVPSIVNSQYSIVN